jgi:hypothetical protein
MDDLIDMIISDESASQVSEKIKDILFAKSAERVDASRPFVAASIFGEETLVFESKKKSNEVEEDDEDGDEED